MESELNCKVIFSERRQINEVAVAAWMYKRRFLKTLNFFIEILRSYICIVNIKTTFNKEIALRDYDIYVQVKYYLKLARPVSCMVNMAWPTRSNIGQETSFVKIKQEVVSKKSAQATLLQPFSTHYFFLFH